MKPIGTREILDDLGQTSLVQSDSVWVIGEALVDLLPTEKGGYLPKVGGGAANTAIALARLGIPTSFIGGISTDEFGGLIKTTLIANGVDVTKAYFSDLPTAVAQLNIDSEKVATYSFQLENTATFEFSDKWLPEGSPKVIHVGSLATVIEPGSSQIHNWIKQLNVPIVFDPNVRPSVISSKDTYLYYFERWAKISSIIKMSEEDLNWIYPKLSSPKDIMNLGYKLLVVTRGSQGISAFNDSETLHVPAERSEVIDTVGAGDTVGAVLVESIFHYGLTNTSNNLETTLIRAAKAAAITCSRAGANPPWKSEL